MLEQKPRHIVTKLQHCKMGARTKNWVNTVLSSRSMMKVCTSGVWWYTIVYKPRELGERSDWPRPEETENGDSIPPAGQKIFSSPECPEIIKGPHRILRRAHLGLGWQFTFCLDFKLSLCSLCIMFSFGYFPGIWGLKADVSEPSIGSIFLGRWNR